MSEAATGQALRGNANRGTLRRAWDEFDAYLFDIDGTLIHCGDGVHYSAFCHALQSIAGRALTLEGISVHGNTDVGILRDAFTLAGIPEHAWRARLPEIREAMCRSVEERQQELCPEVLPRVGEVLRHLRQRGAVLGIATGNLRRIGSLKLQRAGLLEMFDFGGWSDEFEFRGEVVGEAARQALLLSHARAAICMVGDTPADIRAARENGLQVIAVATGIYSFDQLAAEASDLCLHNFAELAL